MISEDVLSVPRFRPEYFKYWLDGIIGTSELIASSDAFRRTWLEGETGITSIYCYDELLEQLLGDLRLGEHLVQFADALFKLGAVDAVTALWKALVSVKESVDEHRELQDQAVLLASEDWRNLQAAAMRVIELPSFKPHGTGRKDIQIQGENEREGDV